MPAPLTAAAVVVADRPRAAAAVPDVADLDEAAGAGAAASCRDAGLAAAETTLRWS